MTTLETRYQEHSIDAVWRYFVDGFTPVKGERIRTFEAFYDVAQGKVVFKLVVEKQDKGPLL